MKHLPHKWLILTYFKCGKLLLTLWNDRSDIWRVTKPGQGLPDAELEWVENICLRAAFCISFIEFDAYDRALKIDRGVSGGDSLQIRFYNFIADDS